MPTTRCHSSPTSKSIAESPIKSAFQKVTSRHFPENFSQVDYSPFHSSHHSTISYTPIAHTVTLLKLGASILVNFLFQYAAEGV